MSSTYGHSNYWLVFSSPHSHLSAYKEAVFAAGAGSYGDYTNVCFETIRTSEFLPKVQSSVPGRDVQVVRVEEVRVQVLV
jgi:hypothetical protein